MAALPRLLLPSFLSPASPTTRAASRSIHTGGAPLRCIRKLTRVRVVDNSALGERAVARGKPAKCIHVYNKRGVARVGDKILVTILGEMRRAWVVGVRQKQPPGGARYDTNNVVLVDDQGLPLGTRVKVPLPHGLRGRPELSKITALASKFV